MPNKSQIHLRIDQSRVGNVVANVLRQRILSGTLKDGDLLPRQDLLGAEFDVSAPSIREAMRILETERLISVRRGKAGGATVHAPTPEAAAYMFGLLLQCNQVTASDVGDALAYLEPLCASAAASYEWRAESLVPKLDALNNELETCLEGKKDFTVTTRRFHDTLVKECGNNTLGLVVGMLESLWTSYETSWADARTLEGSYPTSEELRYPLKAHIAITDAIAKGDPDRARRLAAKHLYDCQRIVFQSADSRVIVAPEL